jgi:DNA adenine methylase
MFDQMRLMHEVESARVTNVASVPHRSPFRYPGGKTWLVPEVRRWLASLPARPRVFCEPFCGGATVGLSVLFDGLTDRLTLVELDEDVAAVWQTILNGQADDLIDRIARFQVSHESVRRVLRGAYQNLAERAFATIVRNRVQRGGILAPGASLMKRGENGRGLASRWYSETLQKRIKAIHAKRGCITFIHGDGVEYMRKNADQNDMVFFVDPPYTVAGRRLYVHSDIDHEELFRVASTLRGDFLMTYDEARPIRDLAAHFGFAVHTVPMKNTHHRIMRELLIAWNVAWAGGEAW